MVVRDGVGLVDAGAGGCGILRPYELAARRYIRQGVLKVLMSEWSSPRQPVCAVFSSSGHVSAKVRVFVDFAQTLMSGERAG
jgi:DNA-binding transcriptional LysR family regulator